MEPSFYTLIPSNFGTLSLVWWETERGVKVHQLFLPSEQSTIGGATQKAPPKEDSSPPPVIIELSEQIQRFLQGEDISFELSIIALDKCPQFHRRVLLADHDIPRGWISTYGRIARHLENPKGARAVGQALARNPFPLIIPCHRAIRTSGELGGFGGGLEMKRALLELEGIKFSSNGRVITDRIYY